ncbi:MAG: DMT family transporter [Rhodobacteraceae bacterium]|nr:DMT family transporter [Paracoccaceae bacterium]
MTCIRFDAWEAPGCLLSSPDCCTDCTHSAPPIALNQKWHSTLPRLLALTIPAVFVLLWSTGFIGSKLGIPYADPIVFLCIRFFVVLPILAVITLVTRADWPRSLSMIGHCLFIGMLVHGLYLGGVFWAIDNGLPAGASAIIVGLQPVLSTLAAAALLKERILTKHWIGLMLGGLGLCLVLYPKLGVAGSGFDSATIGAVLISVVAISLGAVYQKRFVTQTNLLTATFWQYVGALILLLPMTAFESWSVQWTGEFIFALFWLAIVLSVGAVLLLMFLIRKGAVSEVSSLFYLVPVAASIEGYFLFGETLTIMQIVGMFFVVIAVLVARLSRSKVGAS